MNAFQCVKVDMVSTFVKSPVRRMVAKFLILKKRKYTKNIPRSALHSSLCFKFLTQDSPHIYCND